MAFFRNNLIGPDRLPQQSRAGDGLQANFLPVRKSTDASVTLTLDDVNRGLIQQDLTLTAARTWTLPTAAILAAAWTNMDIGDTYSFVVTNGQAAAFKIIIAVGTGITAIGTNNSLSTPPECSRFFTLKKTAAATFDLY